MVAAHAIGLEMGKSCCAIGCTNRYYKGCGLEFTDFLKILKEGGNGLLLYIERTGYQASSRGYAAATSLVERSLTIQRLQRTILLFSAM